MVRKLANEPHRIRESIPVALADIDLSGQRIHRSKQAVLDEDVLSRQRFEQARLPGVRVADERRRREIAAPLSLIGAVFCDGRKALLDHRDLRASPTAVRLSLCFTWPAEPATAADARRVAPR